ncbi:MAG: helix-turn-helix transcriptional regulator [Candidatus Thorarchaeota archaeon]
MSDVEIDVKLHSNGTSYVQFSAKVTNRGSTGVSSLNVRIELRSIVIVEALVDGMDTSVESVEEDRYTRVVIAPSTQIEVASSVHISMIIVSESLQEQVGLCEERGLCLENMIYYVRPFNEFQNFRFTATLPQHAVLDTESPPLYPIPTSNHTDGLSLVFVWEAEQILPGQERVYIVKYGIPMTSLAAIDTEMTDILLMLVAVLGGAFAVIVIERAPNVIKALRAPRIIAETGVTDHENEILRFLSKKGGSSLQRDIYRELDMSQSLASMILTGLEQRGMIKRFREGRENVVHLVEE